MQALKTNKLTDIREVEDDGTIARITKREGFDFTPISEIADLGPNDTVDLVGIAYVVGPVGQVQLKSGEVKHRRNILLIDESNLSICVCFWGEKVVCTYDFANYPVVALRNAKVSDFAQKSLNSNEDSLVLLNSDMPRC